MLEVLFPNPLRQIPMVVGLWHCVHEVTISDVIICNESTAQLRFQQALTKGREIVLNIEEIDHKLSFASRVTTYLFDERESIVYNPVSPAARGWAQSVHSKN